MKERIKEQHMQKARGIKTKEKQTGERNSPEGI